MVTIFCSKSIDQYDYVDFNNVIRINSSTQIIKIYMGTPPYIC